MARCTSLSLLLLSLAFVASSCGGNDTPTPVAGKRSGTAQQRPDGQLRPEDLPDEPDESGLDTLPIVEDESEAPGTRSGAASYEALENYLPEPAGEYEPVGNAGGSRLDIAGHTVSTASQEWRGADGTMRIVLNDCGRSPDAYAAVLKELSPKGSAESFSDDRGLSRYESGRGRTEVVLGARGRYIVEIEATGGGDRSEELQALAEEAAAGLP